MIYIKKNQLNPVVLTLSESSQLANPYFLFEFIQEFNTESNPIYFTTTDDSLSQLRYNLFNINETTSGSVSGGTNVSLNLMAGQYRYNVYESSASTLSVSATTGQIIETGRMVVDDLTNAYINQIIPSINNNTPNIYL